MLSMKVVVSPALFAWLHKDGSCARLDVFAKELRIIGLKLVCITTQGPCLPKGIVWVPDFEGLIPSVVRCLCQRSFIQDQQGSNPAMNRRNGMGP